MADARKYDVIVVGGGNAALCAALSARENGAEIVVLPEAFLSAYPRHLDFRIGSRTPESREWYGRYVRVSLGLGPPCNLEWN